MIEQEENQTQEPSEAASETAAELPSGKKELDLRLAVISSILLLISSVMIFICISTYAKGLAAQQYKMYDANVAEIVEHFDPIGIRKEAVMRFWIKGAEKTAQVPVPLGRVLKKGELTVVFCDPEAPEVAVLTQEIDYDTVIVVGAFGFFLLSFGVLVASKVRK